MRHLSLAITSLCYVPILAFISSPPAKHYAHRNLHVDIFNEKDHVSGSRQRRLRCYEKPPAHSLIEGSIENNELLSNIYVEESRLNQAIDHETTIIFAVRTIGVEESNFSCEGYLTQNGSNYELHLSITVLDRIHFDSENSEAAMDQFATVFHRILLQYLAVEQIAYEHERDGLHFVDTSLKIILLDDMESELLMQLVSIGIGDVKHNSNIGFQLQNYLPFLNDFIFRNRGTDQGNTALDVLKMLCQRRVPFTFSNDTTLASSNSSNNNKQTVISLQKNVLPTFIVESAMNIINEIKSRQLLSSNPDSVDGLPSLHLNLISEGKPLIDKSGSNNGRYIDPFFAQCTAQLTELFQPYLYSKLLPSVQSLLDSPTVEILDVFIRNYGCSEDTNNEQPTRYTLSAHYDITAYATCVITLDSISSMGKNGLYTIPPSEKGSTNNAALRQFFPLDKGDGVVHTFDILHGVDIDPDLKQSRTSLIIWFRSSSENNGGNTSQPWLEGLTDGISQYVSGMALEEEDSLSLEALNMYISSATQGNVFATASLANLCSNDKIPASEYERISCLIPKNVFFPSLNEGNSTSCKDLANALFYNAAIDGGNPMSQHGLALSLMISYASEEDQLSQGEKENLLLMASVLFTMAYNNHYQDSLELLEKLMSEECKRLHEMGIDIPSPEFFSSPVIQVLLRTINSD